MYNYIPQDYQALQPPSFTATPQELQLANQYYNNGFLGIGSGYNIDEALANGVNPKAIYETGVLNSFKPNYLTAFGQALNIGNQLASLYMGWQNYSTKKDLLKEQLKMAKEQHQATMDEVNRIKKLRKNLASFYRS